MNGRNHLETAEIEGLVVVLDKKKVCSAYFGNVGALVVLNLTFLLNYVVLQMVKKW